MGLITLVLLCAFSLLYLSGAIPNKPPFVEKALAFIKQHLDYLAMGGIVYGLLAFCIAPIQGFPARDVFTRMLANALLIAMAMPYSFEKLAADHEAKINPALMREARNLMATVTTHAKIVGAAGAIVALLLFGTIFQ